MFGKCLVEGHCHGISSGLHQISLYLGLCEQHVGVIDTYTGMTGVTNRIIVEEFRTSTGIYAGKLVVLECTINTAF